MTSRNQAPVLQGNLGVIDSSPGGTSHARQNPEGNRAALVRRSMEPGKRSHDRRVVRTRRGWPRTGRRGSRRARPGRLQVFLAEHACRTPGDIQIHIQDMVVEGDRVAVRVILEGTHSGDGLGSKATGRPVRIAGIVLCVSLTAGWLR